MAVSAVIPAYNEEKTVGGIVQVVKSVPEISEVIVVSDGSEDQTAVVAATAGATVIDLQENHGKGGAMMAGVKQAKEEIILFLDADLIGLTPDHIVDLITPVIRQEADMTIGIFEKGRLTTDLAQLIAPYLSGQRVVHKEHISRINNLEMTRYGVEVALTRYAVEHNLRVKEVHLPELSHIMKEEKLGIMKGFAARMKMYWEIAKFVGKG